MHTFKGVAISSKDGRLYLPKKVKTQQIEKNTTKRKAKHKDSNTFGVYNVFGKTITTSNKGLLGLMDFFASRHRDDEDSIYN